MTEAEALMEIEGTRMTTAPTRLCQDCRHCRVRPVLRLDLGTEARLLRVLTASCEAREGPEAMTRRLMRYQMAESKLTREQREDRALQVFCALGRWQKVTGHEKWTTLRRLRMNPLNRWAADCDEFETMD